jgi:hypothetical protein
MCAWLAQWASGQIGHLIGTNHQGAWVPLGDLTRFGQGQPPCQCGWLLARRWGFIHLWCRDFKRQAQARQQLTAVSGGGTQYQRTA